jgi:hypothetical protein
MNHPWHGLSAGEDVSIEINTIIERLMGSERRTKRLLQWLRGDPEFNAYAKAHELQQHQLLIVRLFFHHLAQGRADRDEEASS